MKNLVSSFKWYFYFDIIIVILLIEIGKKYIIRTLRMLCWIKILILLTRTWDIGYWVICQAFSFWFWKYTRTCTLIFWQAEPSYFIHAVYRVIISWSCWRFASNWIKSRNLWNSSKIVISMSWTDIVLIFAHLLMLIGTRTRILDC